MAPERANPRPVTVEAYRRLLSTSQACATSDPDWRRTLAIARLGSSAGVLELDPLVDDPSVDIERAYARLLELAPNQEAINGLRATRHLLELEAGAVH